ncbi:MAG TPA: CDP-alcohol phosphatidyltransferase family protein [Kofleriaceae bacterium]|nr:CDP-alcohol phosphatidyltransferase family protein [Kofleriaceae bacterium]
MTGLHRRKFSEIIGPFLTRYALWVLQPVERSMVRLNISPNVLTFASLLVCAGAGAAIGAGLLATGAWLYASAGVLDILDGRLARATNQQSRAGAFLDSVADRWGELFVFAGFAWYLRGSDWLAVVMFAVAGSIMVSYTRARGEALGIEIDGGTMQRAERVSLVSIGTLCTAFFNAAEGTQEYGAHVIGAALLIVAVASCGTAVHRWMIGYRMLKAREDSARVVIEPKLGAEKAHEPTGKVNVAITSTQRPAA